MANAAQIVIFDREQAAGHEDDQPEGTDICPPARVRVLLSENRIQGGFLYQIEDCTDNLARQGLQGEQPNAHLFNTDKHTAIDVAGMAYD